jgi:hypothetical protein
MDEELRRELAQRPVQYLALLEDDSDSNSIFKVIGPKKNSGAKPTYSPIPFDKEAYRTAIWGDCVNALYLLKAAW